MKSSATKPPTPAAVRVVPEVLDGHEHIYPGHGALENFVQRGCAAGRIADLNVYYAKDGDVTVGVYHGRRGCPQGQRVRWPAGPEGAFRYS